jgi:predicted site-specific integrase-resolvase
MKLSGYANKVGVPYKTAYCWFKVGKLRGDHHERRIETG